MSFPAPVCVSTYFLALRISLGFLAAASVGLAQAPDIPGTASTVPFSSSRVEDNLPGGMRFPLTKPTLPAPLTRYIQPWEPQRALVVALAPSFITHQSGSLQIYLELFRLAAPYLDILVLVPYDRPEVQVYVTQLLSHDPKDAAWRNRVHFVPATNVSVWARDFLPQYAAGTNGRLIVLDSRQIDFTSNPTQALRLFSNPDINPLAAHYRRLQEILSDDIAPAYLASFLRTNYRYRLQLVRPPISLEGGDFITLDNDNVILSQSTLRYNGEQDEEVEQVLRDYYGLKNVHFLETLPGLTIDHLDFIMMPANRSTVLIAEPPPRMESPQIYDSILQDQVTKVLNDNRRYLEENFPDKTLIPVPMPPIPVTSRGEVLMQIRKQVLQELCNLYFIKWSDVAGRPEGDPLQMEAQKKFERSLAAQFGQVDLNREEDLDRVVRVVFGSTLSELEKRHVNYAVAYRTYLNALFLHNVDGKQAVIIPRYKPQSAREAPILAAMETQVMAAYKKAFPTADLLWLDCDSIIGDLGAVHCITHTVPAWPLPASRPQKP